jgi:ankyrin repeat protein
MPVNVRGLTLWSTALLLSAATSVAASDRRLVDALKKQEMETARAVLKETVDVDVAQPDGATALHWAAHWDNIDITQLLIRAGANVNAANDLGVTPLFLGCRNGNAALVVALLKAGANPNTVLATGETPLMWAAQAGNADVIRALLAHGAAANVTEPVQGQTALMWAAVENHAEAARALIDAGADVHARTRPGGFTALLFAAREGAAETVRLLLSKGASVNDSAADGSSVLLLATVRGHWALATTLLDRGANPNADGAGYTALHWAAGAWESELSGSLGSEAYLWMAALGGGKLDLVKALLAHGANPNARVAKPPPRFGFTFGGNRGPSRLEIAGATPFLLAADAARADIMRVLVASGADPLLTTNDKTTPLMMAAGFGYIDAMSRASEAGSLEAAKLALELGAEVTAANDAGETALHGAAYAGWNSVVQLLVDKGAQINAKNKRGWTPLTITEGYIDRSTGSNPRYRPETAALLRKMGGVSDTKGVP